MIGTFAKCSKLLRLGVICVLSRLEPLADSRGDWRHAKLKIMARFATDGISGKMKAQSFVSGLTVQTSDEAFIESIQVQIRDACEWTWSHLKDVNSDFEPPLPPFRGAAVPTEPKKQRQKAAKAKAKTADAEADATAAVAAKTTLPASEGAPLAAPEPVGEEAAGTMAETHLDGDVAGEAAPAATRTQGEATLAAAQQAGEAAAFAALAATA